MTVSTFRQGRQSYVLKGWNELNRIDQKKITKGIILFVVYVVIFAFLIKYVSGNTEIIDRVMHASHTDVMVGLMCSCVCIMLSGLMDVTCAHLYGVNIGHAESVGLTFVASAINLILPLQMGSMVKAVYLKKKLSLTYARYISIISGTAVINIMITFVQIVLCMIIVSSKISVDKVYTYFFISVFALMMICIFIAVKKQEFIMRFLPFKRISTPIMEGFYELITDRKTVMLVSANLLASSIFGGIRFFLIFRMLGFGGSALDGLLYYGLYNASSIIPLLPGNIGFSEAIVGIMNSLMGSAFDIGVTAVLINRMYYYIIAIIGAAISAFPLWVRYNKGE